MRKKEKARIQEVTELITAIGTLLVGIASLIQAIR